MRTKRKMNIKASSSKANQLVAASPQELTSHQISSISQLRIHPGIGVARIGNSTQDFMIGPEIIHRGPTMFNSCRDAQGAIKRQAARFRIYGYDANGKVVAEIHHTKNTDIQWSVHVANKKAAWYAIKVAMDIPITADVAVPYRNANIKGKARTKLQIDPGEKFINGINKKGNKYHLVGNFLKTKVKLGELQTDALGRLLVLPGHGKSDSPEKKPIFKTNDLDTFNNAAGWYDDIADGPVHAVVTLGNKKMVADPSWVITAPPNFAPDLVGWRTMNDLMQDVFIQAGMTSPPKKTYFTKHILPILERLSRLQWLNQGFASMFGAGSPMNFSDPALIAKLAHKPLRKSDPDTYAELRRTIYNSFRPINNRTAEERAWPWIYGDAFGYTDPDPTKPPSPNKFLNLSGYFDHILKKWLEGEFENDWSADPRHTHQQLEHLPLDEQPNILDQAAMHNCLADAFHPGAEITWPMRHATIYRAPYRIKERKDKTSPEYGNVLNSSIVLSMDGPLYEQGPGELTRWMALPWQGDTSFCRSGYDVEYDPYLPTFWPAAVPNHVLTETDYETLCDKKKTMTERLAAFHTRASWVRQLPSHKKPPEQMLHMVKNFGHMGIIEGKPRPEDIDWLPDIIYVENVPKHLKKSLDKAHREFQKKLKQLDLKEKKIAQAGWHNEEHLNAFRTIKRRHQ